MQNLLANAPKANRGDIVRTTDIVRGKNFMLIPAGCNCTVVQVDQVGQRYRYLVELNGMTVWAEDSEVTGVA